MEEARGKGTQLKVRSLWYMQAAPKIISISDVIKISKELPTAAINEWRNNFLSEVRRTQGKYSGESVHQHRKNKRVNTVGMDLNGTSTRESLPAPVMKIHGDNRNKDEEISCKEDLPDLKRLRKEYNKDNSEKASNNGDGATA